MTRPWSRGSEWRLWDVHLHTPGTLRNNGFPADSWDEFIERINNNTPTVSAIGVTDYCSLRSYIRLREYWEKGRLPQVRLLFPNIEFRLAVQTKQARGINLHLLFSPDDVDHIDRIQRTLGRLTFSFKEEKHGCTDADLIRLGRLDREDPNLTDEAALSAGANQFKVEFEQLRDWRANDQWLRANCLVAVAAGKNDGTSGVQHDEAFAARRKEIERFADIIFSGNSTDGAFWVGRGRLDPEEVRKKYGTLKPCLHGSDAHDLDSVLSPNEGRYCWIKADPTFEGLRQTLLEPFERVVIGPDPPSRPDPRTVIRGCAATNAPWLKNSKLEFNDGLVAIIGPRGSGKTALADLLAVGTYSSDGSAADTSFIHKAREHLSDTAVTVAWGDGEETSDTALAQSEAEIPRARYLSQQFVERLCNSDGLNDDLVREVESVVFHSIPQSDRLDAASFTELRMLRARARISWPEDPDRDLRSG